MDNLLKTLYKQGKFNIRYVIGRNLYPWEYLFSIRYSDIVYTISVEYMKTRVPGETRQSLS